MPCPCSHSNQGKFAAEINIHFPGGVEALGQPSGLVFPHVLVCLDCGSTHFSMDKTALKTLTEQQAALLDRRARSKGTAA